MEKLFEAWEHATNFGHEDYKSRQEEIATWDYYAKAEFKEPETPKTVLSQY